MKRSLVALLFLSLWFGLAAKPAVAASDEYDDSQSHPLRVLAYLVHPAAFLIEWTVFRPFHYLVSATEAQEALFGHTPHAPVLSEPQPIPSYGSPKKKVSMSQPTANDPQSAELAIRPRPAESVSGIEASADINAETAVLIKQDAEGSPAIDRRIEFPTNVH